MNSLMSNLMSLIKLQKLYYYKILIIIYLKIPKKVLHSREKTPQRSVRFFLM